MNLNTWDALYKKSIDSQYEHFSSLSSILLAYNINIDLITHVTEKDLPLLKKTSFFPQLTECMTAGKAKEVIISEDDRTILESLHHHEKSMGGQAGIMANLFSLFPIPEIVLYTPMCKEQAQFLSPSEAIVVPDAQCRLVDPSTAPSDRKPDYHFILEFKKGMKIAGDPVPRDNRFIASCPLSFPEHACDSLFDRPYNHAIISGFHLLETPALLDISESHIKALNHHTQVHYECASTRLSLLNSLIEYFTHFDSLGVNECELNEMLTLLGEEPAETVVQMYEGLKTIKKTLNLSRIHLHHLGFYLTLIDSSKNPQRTRDALLYSALMAAARAARGTLSSWKDAQSGITSSLSSSGISSIAELATYLDSPQLLTSGIHTDDQGYLVSIPTRVVDNPVRTVGLGDTISGLSCIGE
jgi:ADP-dependent phosphofructokinase/glucokinase